MKKEFKEKQIEIYQDEQSLANKTQMLLTEMFKVATPTDFDKLKECELDDENVIIVEVSDMGLRIEDSDGYDVGYTGLESLSQVQQKIIIDTLLMD